MKKFLILCLLAVFPQVSSALIIQNIIISPISDAAINVHVNTQHNYTYGYNSYQFNLINNILTLDICYDPGMGAAISYLQNDFEIPLDNTTAFNYQLVVNVYFTNQQTFLCDYLIVENSATLSFATPLTEPVSLGISSFESPRNITLYPNPTTGIIYLGSNAQSLSTRIFDRAGRFVKYFKENEIIDLSGLKPGNYFLILETGEGISKHKIILKK